tara:strand:+ start:399 stop:665 length:267 start_codon:yes stop_codon:yes gene_type:complete
LYIFKATERYSIVIARSSKVDIGGAISRDLMDQGVSLRLSKVDSNRVARAAVREIRAIDDDVFEAAGVASKSHRDNFIKIIDELMRVL